MSLLDRRFRGFRLVDLWALGLLIVLILGVYLAKTIAGGERAAIASVERRISAERLRVRLLQAEVAHLERPSRIERLSSQYLGLGAVKVQNEVAADDLGALAAKQPPEVKIAPPEAVAPAEAEAAPSQAQTPTASTQTVPAPTAQTPAAPVAARMNGDGL